MAWLRVAPRPNGQNAAELRLDRSHPPCLRTASLLNSICDVKPQLIVEKQIKFHKLNFLASLPATAFAQSGLPYLLCRLPS